MLSIADGFGMPSEGLGDDITGGDEEGGGWEVDDDDLELPEGLVSMIPSDF